LKIIHFEKDSVKGYGILGEDHIFEIEGDIFSGFEVRKDRGHSPVGTKILPPVLPSKVVAVGINYRDHAEEFGHDIPAEPVLFMKPSSSVVGHGDAIVYPSVSKRVDYEAEIAAVVKKRAYRVSEGDAEDYILGYTCLNDVTARDLQRKDGQWTRAKAFDTFCPIGPVIETDIDPNHANIFSRLNGETRQSSNTKNFIVPLFALFSFISQIMTLFPGDIITTGTPSGVGEMKPGDTVEVEVEGIGILKNRVISAPIP
jgi:2-keto-4-pentenoate hydratase/2-oxohepta-3-ene-1,7-dioic acid hydratase in catechol pathway